MNAQVKIAILGAAGRMGRMLIGAVADRSDAMLAAAIDRPGGPADGQDCGLLAGRGASGVMIGGDAAAAFASVQAAIEFSSPAASARHAELAAQAGVAYVVGTTGLPAADEEALRRAARLVPVVYAANFSIGMTLLADLVQRAAAGLGAGFDIEIVEMHHRHKVDAPSGSALMLGRAAAEGRGIALDAHAVRNRDGVIGARPAGAIGFAALRGGDVPGDHTVIYAGDGERLELTHRAGDRAIFARGAVRAALWAVGRPAGLYSMRHVLGLED